MADYSENKTIDRLAAVSSPLTTGTLIPCQDPGDTDKLVYTTPIQIATCMVPALSPAWYERDSTPYILGTDAAASRRTIVLPLGSTVVDSTLLVRDALTTYDLNVPANWDASQYATASNRAGKNFYIYAVADGGIILSANATVPDGYTATTSRKIGGIHCLCLSVGTISGHTLTGFVTGDILPQSVWDLKHRPICGPEGMVYLPESGLWVDIYLMSGTGSSTESAKDATITDTRNWMDFCDDLGAVGKRLLTDCEFQVAAAGSNEETNISTATDPVTTGGHTDTGGRRMISNYGLEDCAGTMWQWLLDQSWRADGLPDTGDPTWSWYDLPGSKGSFYKQGSYGDTKLWAGGSWGQGLSCGSRCRHAYGYRWNADESIGGRGCARGQGA